LRRALDLSVQFGSAVQVVHVAPPGGYVLESLARRWHLTRADREARLADFVRQGLQAMPQPELPVQTELLLGVPEFEIARAAQSWGADLVVVGGRVRQSAWRQAWHDTAAEVLRRVSMPLLVVRPQAAPGLRRILALTLGGAADAAVLDLAGSWARSLGAKLGFLELRCGRRSLRRQVCADVLERQWDLVVVPGAGDYVGLMDVAFDRGSAALELVRHCPCSVLVAASPDVGGQRRPDPMQRHLLTPHAQPEDW
jgi:nucleotide-binding universal stress UspA family protein